MVAHSMLTFRFVIMYMIGFYCKRYEVATDSPVMQSSAWYKISRFLFGWIRFGKKKEPARHTMSVDELVALRDRQKQESATSYSKVSK